MILSNDEIIYLLIGIFAIVILRKLFRLLFRRNKLGINGKLIWVDESSQTKPFFNNAYNIFGKPDLMYKIPKGVLAVEYKSRRGKVYLSDIIQAKTASLAARGSGYKVVKVLVKTATQERYFDLPKSDKDLYSEISNYVELVRQAKRGEKVKASASTYKCRACAYKASCSFA